MPERRPRLPADLAERIDMLADGLPFEAYVRDVLTSHADHNLGTPDEEYVRERGGDRIHDYRDPSGAILFVDRPTGEHHTYEGVLAMLAVSDEDEGCVGVYLDEAELRALRDVCTQLLGDLS